MGSIADSATIYLTTPTLGRKVWDCWLVGYGQACRRWSGRFRCEFFPEMGISLARDRLAAQFLLSGCSHWLNIDSDELWTVDAAELLIDLDVDVATGIYATKDDRNDPVLYPIPDEKPSGPWKIESAGAGFQLVKRGAIQRMFEAYSILAYDFPNSDVKTVALHQPAFFDKQYRLEDISFYLRWRDIGGETWAHPDAVAGHFDGLKMHWPRWGNAPIDRVPLPDKLEMMRAPNGTAVLHDQANGITTAATVAEAQLECCTPEELAASRWRDQLAARDSAVH